MDKLKGYIGVRGQLAYVPQQGWIQNMTLRSNVTFNKSYNHRFYNRVIDACELRSDLAMFPNGDATEIGEKVFTFEFQPITFPNLISTLGYQSIGRTKGACQSRTRRLSEPRCLSARRSAIKRR
jgi:hypothetical protein